MATDISQNSRMVARNTLLLYFRMLLMMFIGLWTSRVVLKSLGVDDYGIYNAVGGVVTLFTFITNSVSTAISRFLAVEIGRGDVSRLKRVFSTSIVMQFAFALLLALLVETVGLWLLNHRLVIPEGRMDAARWVLHFSLGVLVVNMMAVPFNATIVAHEKMSAFAVISIFEAVLKISVALLLYVSAFDKLQTYAVLMFLVALIVRFIYGTYCHRCYPESRGPVVYDPTLMKEMSGMAGWSFFGSSAVVFNTAGMNVVVNIFFGVAVNAARAVAAQVEGIVKQFVTNFLTALNPQITKSYAASDKEYCFELVRKGSKYSMWTILLFLVPVGIFTPRLLGLWLVDVPEYAVPFVRLTMIGLLIDMTGNPLLTLMQATGKVRNYYLVTGLTSYLCLPLAWLSFKLGAPAIWAYLCFIFVYALVFVQKLVIANRQTGFPVGRFFRGLFTITPGERAFIFRKIGKYLPDRMFLKEKYFLTFGRRLDLKNPDTFNAKVQWLKLYDRNPLYHTLVDKAEVKGYVADRIGEEYVVPTLGVWDSVEEIDWDSLPERFVIKCTHDSGSTVICRDRGSFDRAAAVRELSDAMSVDFYGKDREWAYKGVKPRIIAEKFLEDDIRDYKLFCSRGEVKFLFVATDRSDAAGIPAAPENFRLMKALSEKLSDGMPLVRIDFYEVGGKVYFGEFNFYHCSGFVPFEPEEWDKTFGEWIG